jgi:hypothetical protein
VGEPAYDRIGVGYRLVRRPDPRIAAHADLESGTWDERYGELRTAPELDVGMRLLVAGG